MALLCSMLCGLLLDFLVLCLMCIVGRMLFGVWCLPLCLCFTPVLLVLEFLLFVCGLGVFKLSFDV